MNLRGKIRAVCTSPEKGTAKRPVESATLIRDFGIEGDAHAGKWHRQVSLLSYESVEAFNRKGAEVTDGDFDALAKDGGVGGMAVEDFANNLTDEDVAEFLAFFNKVATRT